MRIRNRIALMEMIRTGTADSEARKLKNPETQLKLYLDIVEAKTDEFTKDSLKNVVELYRMIMKITDNYFLLDEEFDFSFLREMITDLRS